MLVTLLLYATCPVCSCRVKGASVRTMRINKCSMRTTDKAGLAWLPRTCPECGGPAGDFERAGLTEDSLAEVNEWRARKGWPAWGAGDNTTGGDA